MRVFVQKNLLQYFQINERPIMYASIFNASKATGFKFELVVHAQPSISGESVQAQHYFNSKVDAKRFAKALNLIAWNY